MQELSDQRQYFHGSISDLEDRVSAFRQHLQQQKEQARIANYQNNLALPEAENKSPATKKRRMTKAGDTQSQISRASNKSSPYKGMLKGR
jgi:hypothetical protein